MLQKYKDWRQLKENQPVTIREWAKDRVITPIFNTETINKRPTKQPVTNGNQTEPDYVLTLDELLTDLEKQTLKTEIIECMNGLDNKTVFNLEDQPLSEARSQRTDAHKRLIFTKVKKLRAKIKTLQKAVFNSDDPQKIELLRSELQEVLADLTVVSVAATTGSKELLNLIQNIDF